MLLYKHNEMYSPGGAENFFVGYRHLGKCSKLGVKEKVASVGCIVCLRYFVRLEVCRFGVVPIVIICIHCWPVELVDNDDIRQQFFLLTCVVSRFIVLGLFLARIRWFSEQNLDAITPEPIRVRTGAVGYTRFNNFPLNRPL